MSKEESDDGHRDEKNNEVQNKQNDGKDTPRKPKAAYFFYFEERKPIVMREHPGYFA